MTLTVSGIVWFSTTRTVHVAFWAFDVLGSESFVFILFLLVSFDGYQYSFEIPVFNLIQLILDWTLSFFFF